jgi:hypothetical protein
MANDEGMMGLSDADREQYQILMRQEQNGTITDVGMVQLQEFRDRMGQQ